MTKQGATLTLSADVDEDGNDETGVFVLDGNINISPFIRTGYLIGRTGSTIGGLIDFATGNDQNRGAFQLDAGGGALGVDIDFNYWEGSSNQWGNTGSGGSAGDATGDPVWRQLSVLIRYLDRGTFDSLGAATLEWGEYSTSGDYRPMSVAPEEPRLTFNAEEQTSMVDGSLTLLSTRSISQAVASQQQEPGL